MKIVLVLCLSLFAYALWGCAATPVAAPLAPATAVPSRTSPPLPSPARTEPPTALPSATATVLPSATPTISATPEPFGCWKPPEDYTRVNVNGWTINQRTLAMLEHAAQLYGGELEISGYHITQGSYHDNGAASFGTHLGGGAVDLSVMRKGTYSVLWEDVEPLIRALRVSGFAAWLREYGEVAPDSPIHLHAIAIGDRELSQAASDQLTGTFGYFRGYTGIPVANGDPVTDKHGGPVLCQWMLNAGYADLRK